MNGQTESGESVQIVTAPTIEAMVRGEIDIQIKTAKAYPRSVVECRKKAIELATLDEETAASCIYALPRAKKKIDGPSVRLAEIIACSWTNLRVAKRILGEDGTTVTAQAVCHDLETNVAISGECKRRITDKYGKRYNDDMITMTANAAASIALRNAVFAAIPQALWKPVYQAARKTAIGDASTLSEKRIQLVEYFAKMGIFADRLLHTLGKADVEEIGLNDLALLRGMATAIKDGETSVDEAFPDPAAQAKADAAPDGKTRTQSACAAVQGMTDSLTPMPTTDPPTEPKKVKPKAVKAQTAPTKTSNKCCREFMDIKELARRDIIKTHFEFKVIGECHKFDPDKQNNLLIAIRDELDQQTKVPAEAAAPLAGDKIPY